MTDTFFARPARPRAGFSPVMQIVRAAAKSFMRIYDRYRQRQALASLDDHLLADLGLTRQDVRRECAKSWLVD